MDEKRPDDDTVVPWKCSQTLVWDTICPDTFAPSHVMLATSEAGTVANQAEDRKRLKYADVLATHHFVPVMVETSGVFGQAAKSFIRELSAVSR